MNFLPFRILDVLDIIFVAFLLYELYFLIRGSVAIKILLGILSLYLLYFLVEKAGITVLGTTLGKFIDVGEIALIIVFQQELRRFLILIGTRGIFSQNNFISRIITFKWNKMPEYVLDIPNILKACEKMSKTKTGALIVITKTSKLRYYIDSGDRISANVSAILIENIFFKNSPLHDGAIIIDNNKIMAARCILPVADNDDFPSHLGFRHRAAVGITQNTDAIAIAVSEEKGTLSYAKNGKLYNDIKPEALQRHLLKDYQSEQSNY